LGRDPDMRFTPSGTPITTLSVATNRTYKGSDGQQVKETTWYKVSVFGKAAEAAAQYLTKGRMVLVEGRLTPDKNTGGPRIWTTKDGRPAANFELAAQEVKFIGGGGQRDEAGDEQGTPDTSLASTGETSTAETEDLPF